MPESGVGDCDILNWLFYTQKEKKKKRKKNKKEENRKQKISHKNYQISVKNEK